MAAKRAWARKPTTPPNRRPPEPLRDSAGRVRTAEAAAALARLNPSALATSNIKVSAHPTLAPYWRLRRKWAKRRMREMADLYGADLTSGVGVRIRAAAYGFAFGEWLMGQAAENADAGMANLAMGILQKASAQDEEANEVAALERKLREKAGHKKSLAEALGVQPKA